jgi:hypothetical protein
MVAPTDPDGQGAHWYTVAVEPELTLSVPGPMQPVVWPRHKERQSSHEIVRSFIVPLYTDLRSYWKRVRILAMLTRPVDVQQRNPVTGDVFPVRPPDWKYLCPQADAQALLAKVSAIPGASVTLVDADPTEVYFVIDADDAPRNYEIHGVIEVDKNTTINVDETVGWLFDRQVKPEPFVDGKGGPNLKYQNFGGDAELYWSA